jgi:hypothetical protein
MKMQKWITAAGLVCLAGVCGMSADLISSSIATDGTAWVSSAVLGEKSYAATLFMNERSVMNRELDFSDPVQAQIRITSSGPVGVYEFSARDRKKIPSEFFCVFAGSGENETGYDAISTLGLWKEGTYLSSRQLRGGQTVSFTGINATGMVSLAKTTENENQSQRERSFVAGQMNITEAVVYEDEP